MRSRLYRLSPAVRAARQLSSGHCYALGNGTAGNGHRPNSPRCLRTARVLRPRGDVAPPYPPAGSFLLLTVVLLYLLRMGT